MLRVAGAVLFLLVLLTAGAGFWAYRAFNAPGPLPEATAIVVPHGGLDEVGEALAHQGVVASPVMFRLAALATYGDGSLRAAELLFPKAASLREVLTVLRTARPVQHHLTIPEGLTAQQVITLLAQADALTGEAATPPEGGVLPETYSYERGATREQLLDRGRSAMDRALEHAWATRTPGLPLANPHEALVLASMIERETGRPEDRPMVARVLLNRLNQGMKLQSDPTVVYGASGGLGVLDHGITRAELDRDDPYNTYRIDGLPPGPICMPGVAALRAATQPAQTDALYFVADGAGGTVFSRTQDEHLRRVAKWREIERAKPAH